jgi:hypothetical protein
MWDFLHKSNLCNKSLILNRVQHYEFQYEVQHRPFLHAYIILCLHLDDLVSVLNNIMNFISIVYNKSTKNIIESFDPFEKKLFKLVEYE